MLNELMLFVFAFVCIRRVFWPGLPLCLVVLPLYFYAEGFSTLAESNVMGVLLAVVFA